MANTQKQLEKVIARQEEVKAFTIKTKTVGSIKGTTKAFATLTEARTIGMQHFRNGSFVKLTNAKGIVLPL